MALVVLALPFVLPGDLSVGEAVVAAAGAAILAATGFEHPRFSPARANWITAALAFAALILVAGQTVLERAPAPPPLDLPGVTAAPRAATPAKPARGTKRHAGRAHTERTGAAAAPARPAPKPEAPASAPAPSAPQAVVPSPPTLRAGALVPAAAPAGAARFVRDYYAALDARRFAVAWRMLAPGVQAAFGGFARWRGGYARTLASTPGSLRVTPVAGGATVGLTLRAEDRGACGKRRFAVMWRLARTEAGWLATAAAARALPGAAPAAAC